MKFSTKGLKTYLTVASATPVALVVTAITKAAPAVVTVSSIGALEEGDIVKISGTGMESLDDKFYIVGTITTNSFPLKCSDTTGDLAAATEGAVDRYVKNVDLVPFCINDLSRDVPAGDTIDLGTFCDPSAQASGDSTAGTLSWGGPIDFCDPGFIEMQRALVDGIERVLITEFPQSIGYMFTPLTVNSYSEAFAFRGAATWTGGAVVNTAPDYRVCDLCT
jgi:hypothetical protein